MKKNILSNSLTISQDIPNAEVNQLLNDYIEIEQAQLMCSFVMHNTLKKFNLYSHLTKTVDELLKLNNQ